MKTDLLTLQAVLVASGILVIWLVCRTKPWRWATRRRADHAPRKNERAEESMTTDRRA